MIKHVAIVLCLSVGLAWARPPDIVELRENHAAYQRWKTEQTQNIPFFLETRESDGVFRARMGVELPDTHLEELTPTLSNPSVWCEFMLLHLNIKACTYARGGGGQNVTFYSGRKHYQEPEEAEPLRLDFDARTSPGLLSVDLYAEDGPYGTSDYHIELYVIPAERGVYCELRVAQRFNFVAAKLGKLYLKTLGRKKVGFTVTGHDEHGEPQYVGGERGVAERNIVRYLLALEVFLKTKDLAGPTAFQRRAELWFDETEKYHRQLRELSRREYLDAKRLEYANQTALQAQ